MPSAATPAAFALVVFCALSASAGTSAQDETAPAETAPAETAPGETERTREAQGLYAAGESAYQDARYEDALRYFRLAAEASPRPELQYNIGLSADRLRLDDEALEAFEAFLEGVDESHEKYAEVQARVRVLRSVNARATAERALLDEQGSLEEQGSMEEGPPSRVGLAVGLSVAAVAVVVGVVLAIVLTRGDTDTTPGNFGNVFEALRAR